MRVPLGRICDTPVTRPWFVRMSSIWLPQKSTGPCPVPLPTPVENRTSPAVSAIVRSRSISWSIFVAKSMTAWKIPPPERFMPSAIATYSSTGA